jgi:hypothetical protein
MQRYDFEQIRLAISLKNRRNTKFRSIKELVEK